MTVLGDLGGLALESCVRHPEGRVVDVSATKHIRSRSINPLIGKTQPLTLDPYSPDRALNYKL